MAAFAGMGPGGLAGAFGPAGWNKLQVFLKMIRFEHTIFALPFAYLGAFLAAGGIPTAAQLLWVTLAMVGARTAALCLNALIDRHLDSLNPRTANRPLPRGLLSVLEVWLYTLFSFALLSVAAWQLNPLCLKLMPIAVFALTIYPYTKRWTWACHLVLGATDGLAPLGAWVAVRAAIDVPGLTLFAAVALWVAGFDIIYATADIKFDRSHNIYSIPARFGLAQALVISSWLHAGAFAGLLVTGLLSQVGPFYWVGVAVAAGLLVHQHRIISPRNLSRSGEACFNLNGYLSVLMFVAVLADAMI